MAWGETETALFSGLGVNHKPGGNQGKRKGFTKGLVKRDLVKKSIFLFGVLTFEAAEAMGEAAESIQVCDAFITSGILK